MGSYKLQKTINGELSTWKTVRFGNIGQSETRAWVVSSMGKHNDVNSSAGHRLLSPEHTVSSGNWLEQLSCSL